MCLRRENKNNKLRLIFRLTLIVLIVVAVGLIFRNFKFKENKIALSNKLDEKISKIAELSTVEYNYTNIIEYSNSKQLSGLNLPFTNKTFLVQYKGKLKAGLDVSGIEVEDLNKDYVLLRVSEPIVLENIINEEDVFFYNEKDTVFNKLEFKELYDILIDEKNKIEKEAIDNGLLVDAKKNSEELIKTILSEMGFKTIEISYY